MNKNKYVFAQLIEFLNNDKFRRLVDKYDGNKYVKHLTCWNQLLALMFGQLSNRESLRDMRKVLSWYNILTADGYTEFAKKEDDEEEEAKAE